MNFLLEVSRNGNARFLYSEGEQTIECNDKQVYMYGIANDLNRLKEYLCGDIKKCAEIRNEIIGSFTAVGKSDISGYCRIIQSTMGGNKTVFYLKSDDKYYIFTSLKMLSVINHKCRFNYNHEIISEFIYNGFIRTKDTLVCDIFKLLPEEYMEIEHGELKISSFERIKPNQQNISLSQMYEIERKIIDSYIDLALSKNESINIAISAGFDSNLILHFLRKRGIPVRGFSIGGLRGLDETEAATRLCEYSGNVSFQKGKVNNEIRNDLVNIVEALEGNLYERGVFLQYSLARLLKVHNVHYILLGEGADQIFNQNFYNCKESTYLTNYNDNPYELSTMVVLKKSSLMLDVFGIIGLYPFISEQMQKLGAQIMDENKTSKIRQKQMCRKYFDEYMNNLIVKNPGCTSLCALFRNFLEESEFIDRVQKTNEFYDPSFRISYKYGPRESELDYYLCLEYLRIFKKIFCD